LQSKVEALALILEDIFSEHNLSPEDVIKALSSRTKEKIPLSAFSNSKLSALEIIVKYLKENKNKKYSEIARLLNRDDRTIWSTYNNAKKKQTGPLSIKKKQPKDQISIPVSIFSSRKTSVLESLVIYLKNLNYTFSQIAKFLKKDYQTIYTSYRRGEAR